MTDTGVSPPTVHVTADHGHWWDGTTWQPAPWPATHTPIVPWWDGVRWNWGRPAVVVAPSDSLYRIARVAAWFDIALMALACWGMATAPESGASRGAISLGAGAVVLGLATAGLAFAAVMWRRLGNRLLPVLSASLAVTVLAWILGFPSLFFVPLIVAAVPVAAMLVAADRDHQRAEASAAGYDVVTPESREPQRTVGPGW